jgi:protocatechuate 3,4-dioxygenase beta subunit
MDHFTSRFSRRDFLAALTVGAFAAPALKLFTEEALRFIEDGDFAQELVRTPAQTEGPFFPDRLPLDTDNDLVVIGKNTTPAVGEITHLSGRILDAKGEPVKGALIEIWQVDNNGAYIHTGSDNRGRLDKNFQGYGKFETASDGAYKFRTIKPVAYPGRTPHIHVKVSKSQRELLTTQCYVKGDPRNDRDGVLLGIRDTRQRQSVIVPFDPIKDSKVGELAAKFEIVLGVTPVA